MTNQTSNTKLFATAAGVLALAVSSAFAGPTASSTGPNPKPGGNITDPLGTMPFDAQFDPNQIFDPTIKDDTPSIPIGYVDIPEIDRDPDGDGGFGPPLGSVAPFPDDLFEPIDASSNPFLINPISTGEFRFFQSDSRDFRVIETPSVALSVPVPSTALISGLAAGVLLRRRR